LVLYDDARCGALPPKGEIMRILIGIVALAVLLPAHAQAKTFSVEGVDNYLSSACGKQMLSSRNDVCDDFIDIMTDVGLTKKWNWRDGDVWGNDFRDQSSTEEFSDEADILLYAGHGTCKNRSTGDCDRQFVCTDNSIGGSNTVVNGTESRWGSLSPNKGKTRWVLFDSSCSMEVVPNGSNNAIVAKLATWLPAFNGLHLATGSHCSPTGDILDGEDRVEDYAEDLADGDTYTDAWMDNGLNDVQDGACAVSMGAGSNVNIALDRMEHESLFHVVTDTGGKPHFLAYSFVCE
jgi:Family of unknown function (DUF6345)